MIELITDRTEEDVLLKNAKGIYGYKDLNRVESAVDTINEYLVILGSAVQMATKTDWKPHDGFSNSDDPVESQMIRYLKNITKIRDVFKISIELPGSMNNLTFEDANRIEAVLRSAISKAEATVQSYFYSGEIYAGEGI